MLLLARLLLNLIYVDTVDITVYYLTATVSHALVESSELGNSSILSNFLALSKVHDFIGTFWACVGVSAVFKGYLVLSDVDSSATSVRLSSRSLTVVQLLFIMKACIC